MLDMDSTKILVQALVISKLDYNIDKIQRLQNMACRCLHKHDHITLYLKLLHWLKIDYRIQYKVTVVVCKCIHGLACLYLSELIDTSHNRQLRLALLNKLPVSRANKALVHKSSFTSMGPQIWNALPIDIITSTSLEIWPHLQTYMQTWVSLCGTVCASNYCSAPTPWLECVCISKCMHVQLTWMSTPLLLCRYKQDMGALCSTVCVPVTQLLLPHIAENVNMHQ